MGGWTSRRHDLSQWFPSFFPGRITNNSVFADWFPDLMGRWMDWHERCTTMRPICIQHRTPHLLLSSSASDGIVTSPAPIHSLPRISNRVSLPSTLHPSRPEGAYNLQHEESISLCERHHRDIPSGTISGFVGTVRNDVTSDISTAGSMELGTRHFCFLIMKMPLVSSSRLSYLSAIHPLFLFTRQTHHLGHDKSNPFSFV
ncbi:hypothetical protein QBC35DRAFT_493877 [Podospora australis]|uniref:Uncharacterized protein n=1 Tax=Podospora australis TaxID=1536484 RepID=A0AAN6WXM6_9PEZI|nr:hypothetical protein QBC35DRAFT_493877 [Podospora australis]